MTRKRYIKMIRAAITQCYLINKANGLDVSGKMNFRDSRPDPGMSYAEAWEVINNALRGIVPACR